MSTRRDHRRSLLLDLENAVLALEGQGHDSVAIHSFVNMILRGFITNGAWTPEYLQLAADALTRRESEQFAQTITNK